MTVTAGLLYGLILRILRDRSEAEEVLQEVFVLVWEPGQHLQRGTRIAGGLAHRHRAESGDRSAAREYGSPARRRIGAIRIPAER